MSRGASTLEQPLQPLWRGLVVYRVLTLVSAAVVVAASLDAYASPGGALAVDDQPSPQRQQRLLERARSPAHGFVPVTSAL